MSTVLSSCVPIADNVPLGDAGRRPLHHVVQHVPGRPGRPVELVDTADVAVSQHQDSEYRDDGIEDRVRRRQVALWRPVSMTTPEVSWPTSSFASNKPKGSERAGIIHLVMGWDGEGRSIGEMGMQRITTGDSGWWHKRVAVARRLN